MITECVGLYWVFVHANIPQHLIGIEKLYAALCNMLSYLDMDMNWICLAYPGTVSKFVKFLIYDSIMSSIKVELLF